MIPTGIYARNQSENLLVIVYKKVYSVYEKPMRRTTYRYLFTVLLK